MMGEAVPDEFLKASESGQAARDRTGPQDDAAKQTRESEKATVESANGACGRKPHGEEGSGRRARDEKNVGGLRGERLLELGLGKTEAEKCRRGFVITSCDRHELDTSHPRWTIVTGATVVPDRTSSLAVRPDDDDDVAAKQIVLSWRLAMRWVGSPTCPLRHFTLGDGLTVLGDRLDAAC